jgi:hypothetical protein
MALGLRQVLWGDGDLAEDEADARKVEDGRKLLLECPTVVADGNRGNVKAALELAEAVAKAETERETNLNTRGAAVATVAGIILPVAAAVAKPVFATKSTWTGFTRDLMEWLFLAALVFVASAMVMAVVMVLRPGRGGRTKNVVGAAVVNVWCQPRGDIALAAAADPKTEVFRLDRLLRAMPTWHYRNRSKARWLRRAWMVLMLGILLIGLAGVFILARLRLPTGNETAVQSKIGGREVVVGIVLALIAVWLLVRFDFVFARRRGWKRGADQEERKQAKDEAARIVGLLVPPSYTPGVAGESSRRLCSDTWMAPAIGRPGWRRLAAAGALSAAFVIVLFALARWVRVSSDWPTAESDNLLLIGILVIGLIPMELLLIDALIRRGGKLSFQGIEIALAASRPAVDLRIDTNIGLAGATVRDNLSTQILDALNRAANSEVVVVDLEDGKAWWETRLFVLAAGGARIGRPRAIVLVTSERGQGRAFLGWATPASLVQALCEPSNPHHATYQKAYALARDAGEKWQKAILDMPPGTAAGTAPGTPAGLTTYPWNLVGVAWNNGLPNPFATEQFLAIELGQTIEEKWKAPPSSTNPDASSAERFPGAVTVTEASVRSQFAGQLHRTAIEQGAAKEDQVAAFLADADEFVAITQGGSYVRLASRSAVLEGLVQQLLVSSLANGD